MSAIDQHTMKRRVRLKKAAVRWIGDESPAFTYGDLKPDRMLEQDKDSASVLGGNCWAW